MQEETVTSGHRSQCRLIGIGVGPGDPDLITVKAVRALREADVILVPSTERSASGAGRAEAIVTAACPGLGDRMVRVPFSMADRDGVGPRRAQAWEASRDAVLRAFEDGARLVCMATVGDPSVYSTFSYLAAEVVKALPDVRVEVVPGITAMQALAAASRTPLVEGTETLALVPVTSGMESLDRALASADTVVLYKAGRQLPEVMEHVRAHRADEVVLIGTNIGLADESIRWAADSDETSSTSYFSTILVAPTRTKTGGRL